MRLSNTLVRTQNSRNKPSHHHYNLKIRPNQALYSGNLAQMMHVRERSPFASVLDFRSDQDMSGHLLREFYNPLYSNMYELRAEKHGNRPKVDLNLVN